MTDAESSADEVVLLRAGGVSILIEAGEDGVPAVLYWGADLGDLSPAELRDAVAADRRPVVNNALEIPLRVALTPEHRAGWLGRPGLLGTRAGDDWSPRFRPIERVRTTGSDGTDALTVRCADDSGELLLVTTIELAPSGLARARASITNLGTIDYEVHELSVAVPTPLRADDVLDFAGRWLKERQPQRSSLTIGTHVRENRRGRTGPDAATLLCVGEPGFSEASGEIWSAHVAFSGNHRTFVDRVAAGVQVIGGGELLLPGEVTLKEEETYSSPWVYLAWGQGLDAVAHRFHDWMRARPQHPSPQRPVTLNVWEAVYFDHSLDALLALVDRATRVGVERFVLDDGWFHRRYDDTAGLGDWFVDTTTWPQGLRPLVDRVVAAGMQFGLWFEPEMVSLDSDLARAHPEWILGTSGRLPESSRNQQVLDLSQPDAYDHIFHSIDALLNEYPISYLKWDHNRDLTDAGHHGSGRAAVSEQTRAVYRLLDQLRAAHPGLEIESCSSGGARVDLEILERTDRVWASDCIDPVERQDIDRWTAQLIPPELIGSHIGSATSHTTGRTHSLAYRATTALFGHLGIEWNLIPLGDDELDELSSWVAFYKENRQLLFSGDTVRGSDGDESIRLRGVVAKDRSRAIYSFAAVGAAHTSPRGRFRLPGLDPERVYDVAIPAAGQPLKPAFAPPWSKGISLRGSLLGDMGLPVPELHPEQAFILTVEEHVAPV